MVDVTAGEAPQTSIWLSCASCRVHVSIPADATSFDCESCQNRTFIFRCPSCNSADTTIGYRGGPPTAWTCRWCLTKHVTTGIGGRKRRPPASAQDVLAASHAHWLTGKDPDATLLGGFRVVAGSGDTPPRGTICSIVALTEGVLVVAEIGADGQRLIRYDDLLDIEVGGGRPQPIVTNVRVSVHSTFTSALASKAISSIAENPRRRQAPVIDSFIRLTARDSEIVLSHNQYLPEAIRYTLSIMFVRHCAAQAAAAHGRGTLGAGTSAAQPAPAPEPAAATPLDELERLTRLHAAGTLTDNEFEAARSKHIRTLRTEAH